MALTFADMFGPMKDLAGRWNAAVGAITTSRTAQYAYPSSGSAVSTPEFKTLEDQGSVFYDTEISLQAAIVGVASSSISAYWIPFLTRYLKDNDTLYEGVTTELGSVLRAVLTAMIIADADIDASTPTAGTVVYGNQNQGNGTATMVINAATTTLAELALAGTVRLKCTQAGYSIQNAERWVLEWVGTDHKTGRETIRDSASRDFRTGVRYFDVAATVYPPAGVCPEAIHQIPQTGKRIHTGLNILITIPVYNTVTESGDTNSAFINWNFRTIDGAKTNLSRRNTEAPANPGDKRSIYIRCTDLVGSWGIRAYSDAALTNPITESVTFTEGTGDATLSLITSAPGSSGFSTNGEHVSNGGHLQTGSTFMQVDIDDSSMTLNGASFTVTLGVNLPFAVDDSISVPITNSYAGILSRFFVQECGFALRTIADTTETIADPA